MSEQAVLYKRLSITVIWRFIWRSLWRDWRAGEVRLLGFAVLIAVAAVSSVSFFTHRVERAISYQAAELLAADLLVSDNKAIAAELIEQAQAQGLRSASTTQFRSMLASAHDDFVMAEIKAVSAEYPLYGQLKIADAPYASESITADIPQAGTAWVENRLLNQLQLQVGESIALGEIELIITKVLLHEPDRGGNLFQVGPRLLMNIADVERSQLLGPYSLASYRLLLAGPAAAISAYQDWLTPQLAGPMQIQTVENARPEIRRALERARLFLGLAVIVAVIIACVAIAVVARHFSERQADAVAVLKCLGGTQGFITALYIGRLLLLALLSSGLGCLLGFMFQAVLVELLADWFVVSLPPAGIAPWLLGMSTGLVVLLGFALPPVIRLRRVSPLRVLRRDLGLPDLSSALLLLSALCAVMLLIYWQAQSLRLALYVLLGILGAVILSGLLAWVLLLLLKRMPRAGFAWRYGLSNLQRRKQFSILQLIAFSLSIMALLLLTIVRVDILNNWQFQLADDTPNHFLVNIQAEEKPVLSALFDQYNLPEPVMRPIVVGRLLAINGRTVSTDDYTDGRSKWLVERDQRLSYLEQVPAGNHFVEGSFWTQANSQQPQWSLERSFAQGLGIKLGDEVTFRVGSAEVSAAVTSLRDIDWDTMQVNFYILGTPAVLQDYPVTYLSSFYMPPGQSDIVLDIIRQFPGITIIDVRAIIQQVRSIMDRAVMAIEYIFIFTIGACLLVLYASISASQNARRKEASLLRALGSSRRYIFASFAVEFFALGSLSAIAGMIMAATIGYFVSEQIFNIGYNLNGVLLGLSVLVASIVIGVAGLLGVRALLNVQPIRALTQHETH